MTRRLSPLLLLPLATLIVCSCNRGSSVTSAGSDPSATVARGSDEGSASDGGTSPSGWYYFSKEGIHPAASPVSIPAAGFAPWTEATRVVDMAEIRGKPAFLVNRLGIMVAGDGSALYRLPERFSASTIGGFVRDEGKIGLRVYRNTTFAAEASPVTGPFLVRFYPETGRFDPWAIPRDLGANPESNCVALDRIGSMWYASFKRERDSRVEFLYLEFERLPEGEHAPAGDPAPVRVITADAWRSAVRPFPVTDMPPRLALLFSSIPETAALSVRARLPEAPTARTWAREGPGPAIEAEAIVSETGAAALFSDGTFVITAENGTRAFTLPRLAGGYAYGCFMITGTTLLAAWEERRFFETGRAGLLEIPLPDGIYW